MSSTDNNNNKQPPPPCRLLFRSKEGVEMFSIPSERTEETTIQTQSEREFLLKGPTSFQAVVPDGSAVLVHRPDKGIFKFDLNNDDTPTTTTIQILHNHSFQKQVVYKL